MIAREFNAVLTQRGLTHIRLRCLPAEWHFAPDRIAQGVREEIVRARAEGARAIFVGYADCGTGGGLDRVCEEFSVERLPGPHCFASFQGSKAIIPEADARAFYITDSLARQPDAFLWRPLGLNEHPELRDMYFGAYERAVYLAQTDDPMLEASARDIANRLDLDYEFRRTGYGDLARFLPIWNSSLVASQTSA